MSFPPNLVFVPSLAQQDKRSLRGDRGFTLLELLLAVSILTAFTAIAVALFAEAQKAVQRQLSSSNLDSNALGALNQMAREIHMAGFPSAGSFTAAAVANSPGLVATTFVTVSGYDLIFQGDINASGTVQQIEYSLPTGSQTLVRVSTQKGLNGALLPGTAVSAQFLMNVQNQLRGKPLFTWDTDPLDPNPFPQNVRTVYVNLILLSSGSGSGIPVNVTLTAACQRMNP